MNRNKTRRLIEAALMVALSTVLGLFKLVEMPYGGSVTFASMLPILILSYRHGVRLGLAGAFASALMEQLLGLKNLSYFTTWQSIVAIILLDYLIAFTLVGLGGIFRHRAKTQTGALLCGVILVCLLRYLCHTISGATVWAGLSIPTEAALLYSLGYNATYMIPEFLVLFTVSYYLGGQIDFSTETPERMKRTQATDSKRIALATSGLFLSGAFIADVALVAPDLQDPESGSLTFSGLKSAPWVAVGIISGIALLCSLAVFLCALRLGKKD